MEEKLKLYEAARGTVWMELGSSLTFPVINIQNMYLQLPENIEEFCARVKSEISLSEVHTTNPNNFRLCRQSVILNLGKIGVSKRLTRRTIKLGKLDSVSFYNSDRACKLIREVTEDIGTLDLWNTDMSDYIDINSKISHQFVVSILARNNFISRGIIPATERKICIIKYEELWKQI